jgi:hypothetical protein
MRNKRRQGNMSSQMVNNHTIEDLVDCEGDETSVFEVKRMMIRSLRNLKRTYKNN